MESVQDEALIGVSSERAARLVGISVHRLASWERIGLVVPEATRKVAGRMVRVFSLGDLVELRVAVELASRNAPSGLRTT